MGHSSAHASTATHLDLSQQHAGGRQSGVSHAGGCQGRELEQEAGHELDATLELVQRVLAAVVIPQPPLQVRGKLKICSPVQ